MHVHQGGEKEEGRSFGIVSRLQPEGRWQLQLCTTVIFSQLPKKYIPWSKLSSWIGESSGSNILIPEVELTKAQTIKFGSLQP